MSLRIQIIGYPGAGKSTLAKTLGEKYSIPVLYMDQVCMDSSRNDVNNEVKEKIVGQFLRNNDSRVVEGNYKKLFFDKRLEDADLIIFLNPPAFIRYINTKRRVKNPDDRIGTPQNAIIKNSPSFMLYVIFGSKRNHRKDFNQISKKYSSKFIQIKKYKGMEEKIYDNIKQKQRH